MVAVCCGSDDEEARSHFEAAIAIDAIAFRIDVMVATAHIDKRIVSVLIDASRFPAIIDGSDRRDTAA